LKKILISIKDSSLIFSYNHQNDEQLISLMNTNVISNNELIFSDEYILNNSKIVGLFIKELINEKKLNYIIITKLSILNIIKDVLIKLDTIDTLYISDEDNFTYEAYEIITKLNRFKKINCYSIPTYMIELFDRHNIIVESRAEILFTSNFMEENNLISYSKIFYKMSVRLSPPLDDQDLKDFETFCKINRYLKTIHFNACSLTSIDEIVKIINKNRIKNTKLIIHDNITNKEIIDELKSKKRLYAKYKINLELKYTEEYVHKNYLKQVIVTTLSLCALIALTILGGASIYVVINNKTSEKNIAQINEQIESKISDDNLANAKEETTPENKEDTSTQEDIDTTHKMIPKMASLIDLNPDTVGWLTVPGTNIDYPVVQTTDNKYYLSHNYNKEKDYNGWVFMNYFNVPQNLDRNTILFAHNRYYSGVMFGTLSNVTKKNWYNEANNISIYYNTLYDNYEWEVFSIYKIDITDDYLKTIFKTDNEWLDFIDMIRERSMFASSATVGVNDKILTLSTCLDNDQRLVVHAVLKKSA
jgi:sortase B